MRTLFLVFVFVFGPCSSTKSADGTRIDVASWPGPRCEAGSHACPAGFDCVKMSPLEPAISEWTCQILCQGMSNRCPAGFQCNVVRNGSPAWCSRH